LSGALLQIASIRAELAATDAAKASDLPQIGRPAIKE
jgi:hypothetical protein